MVFSLYVLSLIMVVLGSLVLKPFITKGQSHAPLFLVLPAYQVPRVVVTLKNTWLRSWAFVVGAGKIILLMTLVVWLMGQSPWLAVTSSLTPTCLWRTRFMAAPPRC